MMEMAKNMDLVGGSGNVFHDLDLPDADTELMQALKAPCQAGEIHTRTSPRRKLGRTVEDCLCPSEQSVHKRRDCGPLRQHENAAYKGHQDDNWQKPVFFTCT